ncbi:zinc finger protein Xfin-like isoform X1 [Macrobrachium nipponense]|uniref:zinc finger protein Xfin-like isoform X1 n=1 Tax=Macrobrachium nipponense TaxID=159736 RepID=UPI0030C87FF6
METYSSHNEGDVLPQDTKDEMIDEYLNSVIVVGKEVAIKRYSSDESKICKIRELGNEFVILEFSGDETEGEENLKICPQEFLSTKTVKCRESPHYQDSATNSLKDDLAPLIKADKNETSSTKSPSNRRLFNCLECTKVFISQVGFDRHLTDHHLDEFDGHISNCEAFNCSESCGISPSNVTGKVKEIGEQRVTTEVLGTRYKDEDLVSSKGSEMMQREELQGEESYDTGTTCDEELAVKDEEFQFKCSSCKKSYRNRRGLNRHLRVHKGEKPYLCLVCCKRYSYKHDLHNHVKSHTDSPLEIHKLSDYVDKPFKCGVCTEQFSFEFDFERHLREHEKGIEGKVKALDKGVLDKGELQDNQIPTVSSTSVVEESVDDDVNLSVSEASVDMESTENLYLKKLRPKKLKSQDKLSHGNFDICIYCKQEFASRESYDGHFTNPQGVKPYRCCVCFRGFSYKQCLQKHLENHVSGAGGANDTLKATKRKLSKCKFCKIIFASNFELQDHLQIHGKTVEKKKKVREKHFECEVCGREFAFERAFLKHCQTHSMAHLYRCFVCERKFMNKRKISFHMKGHNKGGHDEAVPDCAEVGQGEYMKNIEMCGKHHNGDVNNSMESNLGGENVHVATEVPECFGHPKMCKCITCNGDPVKEKREQSTWEFLEGCDESRESNSRPCHMYRRPCEHEQSGSKSCVCLQCKKTFQNSGKLDRHKLICSKLISVNLIINSLL